MYSRYNVSSDKLEMSRAVFKKSDLNVFGRIVIRVGSFFKVLHVHESTGKDKELMEINNMTLINLVIKLTGPIHERNLTAILMVVQVCVRIGSHPTLLSFSLRVDE